MAIFRFFKTAATAALSFKFFVWNFAAWNAQEDRTVDTVLNFVENGQNAAEIRRFFYFQDGGRSHLGFLNFWNFNGRNAQGGETVSLSNCVKIGQTAAKIWRFFDFCRMAAAAILYSQNFKFLTVGQFKRIEVSHLPNYIQIGQNEALIWRFVDFSRWRPPPSWIFKILNF